MRILQAVFLGMFVYGLWTVLYGAGLLAGMMFLFNVWAGRKFAADDKAYAADPRNARAAQCPTSDALTEHDCECMRSRF